MYILFDIGGSQMRVAGSHNLTDFSEPVIKDTPQRYDEGIALLIETIKKVSEGGNISGICGDISGVHTKDKRRLFESPHLHNWVGEPIVDDLEGAFGAKTHIMNDAMLVGLGEAVRGAGKEYFNVTYITISTGVGGALINQGVSAPHVYGFEPGRQVVDIDGSVCEGVSQPCTLEDLVSGSAVEKRFGKKPYDILQSDPLWDELARWTAVGLRNTILHWSPEVVVLGGSMVVGDPYIPVDVIEQYLLKSLTIFPEIPKIKKAELGDVGGLHGACVYLQSVV